MEALFNAVSQLTNIQRVHRDIHWFLEGAPKRAYSDILSKCGQHIALTLEIEPGMDGEAYKALEWENGCIELSLFEESILHGSTPAQYLMLLDLAMELNSENVKQITLDLECLDEQSTSVVDEFWIQLAKLLAHYQQAPNNHQSSRPLEVQVYVPSTYQFKRNSMAAFAELLQNHFGLQVQFLRETAGMTGAHEKEPAMHSQIDAYLCLNQNKGGYLMEHLHDISPEQWVESFAAVNNDQRCVHYYLRQLPWMCEQTKSYTV